MRCSQPPALSDAQISTALNGQASPDILAHLTRCASCAARYNQARQFERALKEQLYRFDCPSARQIADYHQGLLEGDVALVIADHLRNCPQCNAERERLRQFLAADQAALPQARPPAGLRGRTLGTIQARVLPGSTAVALRGAAPEPIIAEAGNHTILLQLRQDGSHGMALTGQLLAQPAERWRASLVEVRQAGVVQYVAPLDQNGGFQCSLPSREPLELRLVAEGEPAIVMTGLGLPADGR